MSGFWEKLPVISMFLLLIALPFLFQDDKAGDEPSAEPVSAEEPAHSFSGGDGIFENRIQGSAFDLLK